MSIDDAVRRAEEMLADGADWIEIGGESTGPNSPNVSVDEELGRVLPVIRAIHQRYPSAHLSVDTCKAAVAKAAIDEGVRMINDVTAGRGDREMLRTVAPSSVTLVLMYGKDPTPRTTIEDRPYPDVVGTVKEFLRGRRDAAVSSGIPVHRIILDPGLGHFVGSNATYSFQILAGLRDFSELGCPLFLSPSRKSFLAGSEKLPSAERLPGTIVASAIAAMNGATYIRTHDVKEVRRGCEIALFTAHPAGSRS